jgi:hypothetical protein
MVLYVVSSNSGLLLVFFRRRESRGWRVTEVVKIGGCTNRTCNFYGRQATNPSPIADRFLKLLKSSRSCVSGVKWNLRYDFWHGSTKAGENISQNSMPYNIVYSCKVNFGIVFSTCQLVICIYSPFTQPKPQAK